MINFLAVPSHQTRAMRRTNDESMSRVCLIILEAHYGITPMINQLTPWGVKMNVEGKRSSHSNSNGKRILIIKLHGPEYEESQSLGFQSKFGDSPVDWRRYYAYIGWPDLTSGYVGNEWVSLPCAMFVYRPPFKRAFVSTAFLVEHVTSWVPPTALAQLPLYVYTQHCLSFFNIFKDWLAGLDMIIVNMVLWYGDFFIVLLPPSTVSFPKTWYTLHVFLICVFFCFIIFVHETAQMLITNSIF